MRHQWVLAVFRAYGFPHGFCSFLEALLHHNFALFSSKGFQAFLYLILAGIVQGCPSAGLCFAVAADPFFRLLDSLQRKLLPPNRDSYHCIFRGCADDIGGTLGSYKLLKLIKPIFDKAALFANLRLNPAKCIIVPTNFKNFDDFALNAKKWLREHISDWEGFQILPAASYLGPCIGPSAGSHMWDKPIAKYWGRVIKISSLGLSAYYAILAYNTYAVTCLEYLCQVFWIPPTFLNSRPGLSP